MLQTKKIFRNKGSNPRQTLIWGALLTLTFLVAACQPQPQPGVTPALPLDEPTSTSPNEVLSIGDEVSGTLEGPGTTTQLSFRTTSDKEAVAFQITSDDANLLQEVQASVLLPGDVLAAQLEANAENDFGAAVIGQATTWTVELKLKETSTTPVKYHFRISSLDALASAGQSSVPLAAQSDCRGVLKQMGINAYIIILSNIPTPYVVTHSTLGIFKFNYVPSAQMNSIVSGGMSILQMGGGSTVEAALAALNCAPFKFQMNFWDTEGGPLPIITPLNARGNPLCGAGGQPSCPSNPSQGQWTSYTMTTTEPIDVVLVECEEVFISTFVLMQ